MNRMKKEEIRKYQQQCKGLNANQIDLLDEVLAVKKAITSLAYYLHVQLFSEETDFMYDNSHDAAVRKQGKNPMNQDYITKTNLKREKLGVKPLDSDGICRSNDSKKVSRKIADQLIRSQDPNQAIKDLDL